jgi:hypothetical protein
LACRAVDPPDPAPVVAAGASIRHRGGRRQRGEKRGERQADRNRRRHGQRRARQERVSPMAGCHRGPRRWPTPNQRRPHVRPP